MANEAKLQAVIALTDKMSKPLKDVNTKLRNLQKPFKSLQGQLKQFDRLSGFNKLRSGLGGLVGQTAKLGAAAGVAAAGIGYMVDKTAEQGDKLAKNARQYGITGQSLQEWTYIADRQGVAQETLNSSLLAFTKRMGEARSGTGALVTLLKKANPAFLDQLLATKGNEEAFRLLIDAMREIKDPQRQAALAAAAFSRSGIGLTNVARASSDEIAIMRNELHAFGSVMSQSALDASEQYIDSQTKLNRVMNGFRIVVAAQLMPVMTRLIERFGQWYIVNKDIIQQKVAHFAEVLGEKLQNLVAWVQDFAPKAERFIDSIGGMKTVLIAAAAVIAGPLLSALATLSVALLTTPAGWVAAGIAAVVYAGYRLVKMAKAAVPIITAWWDVLKSGAASVKTTWEPISKWFKDMWDAIGVKVDQLWQKIQPVINGVSGLYDNVTGFFGDDNKKQSVNGRSVNASVLQQTQKAQVGGEISVKISADGKPRVQSVKSNTPNFDIVADVGYGMVGM